MKHLSHLLLITMLYTIATGLYAQSCATCNTSNSSSSDTSTNNTDSSCCSDTEVCGNVVCKTVFLPFSQGENRARDYAGIDCFKYVNNPDETSWYFTADIAYQENFHKSKLGAYFFPNGTNTLHVGPDQSPFLTTTPDPTVDVSGFEVLLSSTFDGTLTINPRIRNVIVEPTLYVGLDKWVEGAWFWTKIPITNTRWFLDCCETVSSQGNSIIALDVFGDLVANLYTAPGIGSPVSAGFPPAPAFGKPDQIQQAFGGVLTVNNYSCPLKAGKLLCCEDVTTAIADIPVHLGYNIVRKDNAYLGVYFRAVFPTGHTKNRQSLFDPTVGYNRWQFGIGTNMGAKLYEKNDTSLSIIADGYYTHIFNKSQCRTFDLTHNGCFSRYLPLTEALLVAPDLSVSQTTVVISTGNVVPIANVFNICVDSGFNWNFDGVVFLQAQHKRWIADLGYEVKARSRESLSSPLASSHLCDPCMEDCGDCCTPQQVGPNDNKQYAIKGLDQTFAYNTILIESLNNATINNATGPGTTGFDFPPIFLNAQNIESQLDYCSGQVPAALSHKLWGHIGYTLEDYDHPISLGLGAEGEWGHANKALSLWGIWGKFAVAYS